MLYKIVEVSTDKASGHLYCLVHFWRRKGHHTAGKPPARINDFLMQLRPTGERIVDPDKPELGTETFDRDLPAEIKANIEAYWARAEAKGYPPDHANVSIQRDNSDPHGVLVRPNVAALRGAGVEKL
ncbi:hypothetical protein LCGC14_2822280 [marine sediment metagenome]|uniref:Uncharacterized protein n=1 Tax=marine sediment metagenome TaxID=412755 RepID=A0A0F8Z3D4_9ZZZZ